MLLKPEDAGFFDLPRALFSKNLSHRKLVECHEKGVLDESFGHRWLIFISILTQKFLQLVAKPLVGFGSFVENFLNLGALNGGVSGIVLNFSRG